MIGRTVFAVAVGVSCSGAPVATADGDVVRLEKGVQVIHREKGFHAVLSIIEWVES